MQTQFSSVDEAIQYYGIPRSSFFRLKKEGKIQVEKRIDNLNKKIYSVYGLSAESHNVTSEPGGPPIGGSVMAVESIPPVNPVGSELLRPQVKHAQYIDEWIAWREQGLYTRPWSKNYKKAQVTFIRKYFERWDTISSKHLETWLTETSVMQKTMRVHKHAPVSSFAKFLVHKEVLDRDEYRRIKDLYPKKSPYYHPEQKIIYQEEIDLILKSLDADPNYACAYQKILNRTLILFLAATGLRNSEMCALNLADLRFSEDPKQAFVWVRCGKGGKARHVPFSKPAQEAVREYLKHRPDVEGNQVFWAFNPKHGYTPLNKDCVARRFHHISEQCGIPFIAHSFRHYRITRWANNPKIPITMVQLWAGHSSLEVTQRYIHTRNEDAMLVAFEAD